MSYTLSISVGPVNTNARKKQMEMQITSYKLKLVCAKLRSRLPERSVREYYRNNVWLGLLENEAHTSSLGELAVGV